MRKNGNYILLLGILILLGIIFIFTYLHFIGNVPEVFSDTVTPAYWAWAAKNNSGEMRLLYYLILGGAAIIFLYHLLLKGHSKSPVPEKTVDKTTATSIAFMIGAFACLPSCSSLWQETWSPMESVLTLPRFIRLLGYAICLFLSAVRCPSISICSLL